MTNIDELYRHYATLPEETLMQLAISGTEGLEPYALEILKAEIHRRGLPGILVEAVDINERGMPADERQRLVAWLRQHPCPMCGGTGEVLNGIVLGGEVSIFFVIHWNTASLLIACPECLERQAELLHDSSLKEAANQQEPTPELLEFVETNLAPLYLRMKSGRSAFEEYDPRRSPDSLRGPR